MSQLLLFLYPVEEYFVNQTGWREAFAFRRDYATALHETIEKRYRANGFCVSWVLFPDVRPSELAPIELRDQLITVDVPFNQSPSTYRYASQEIIFAALPAVSHVRVAGFHLWDCVQRTAREAHRRGIDTLVDEDLTELSAFRLVDRHRGIPESPRQAVFDPAVYQPPRIPPGFTGEHFLNVRSGKPWMAYRQPTA